MTPGLLRSTSLHAHAAPEDADQLGRRLAAEPSTRLGRHGPHGRVKLRKIGEMICHTLDKANNCYKLCVAAYFEKICRFLTSRARRIEIFIHVDQIV